MAGSEPTGEYRVQYFLPPYLLGGLPRPAITSGPKNISYNSAFTVNYNLTNGTVTRWAAVNSLISLVLLSGDAAGDRDEG